MSPYDSFIRTVYFLMILVAILASYHELKAEIKEHAVGHCQPAPAR